MLVERNKSVAPGFLILGDSDRVTRRCRAARYGCWEAGLLPAARKTRATRSFGLGAQDKAFASVLQLHFGQAVQIELDVCPLAGDLFGLKTLLQGRAQDESQKGAEARVLGSSGRTCGTPGEC